MPLRLERDQILAFRRRVGGLDDRVQWEADSVLRAVRAGLQDSMPRAALLSLHARLLDTPRDALDEPVLTQVWGPRFSVFVVADEDAPVFTLGRMPDGGTRAKRALETIARLEHLLGDDRMSYGEAGKALGVHPNSLRYGTLTGRIRLRWEGARQPTIWLVPPPEMDPVDARLELGRRYLHVFGPATALGFSNWAGMRQSAARAVLDALESETIAVDTPLGERRLLASDEENARRDPGTPASARLLPSGDAFYLLWGADRALVVPDPTRRDQLWTSRVWPGAVLVAGEVAGIWRRSKGAITVEVWRSLTASERDAIESEAVSMPLPETGAEITVRWAG